MAEKESKTEEGKKSGLIKYLLIGVVVVALLAGAGAAGFFFSSSNLLNKNITNQNDSNSGDAKGQNGEGEDANPFQIGPMLDIDSFIVNILDAEGTHYLKASVTLEVDAPTTLDELNQRMPQIRDSILLLVGNKTFKELADLQGKLQLRAELTSSLNRILKSGEIKKIYFTDFVVQ